jgi:hypothetical protein
MSKGSRARKKQDRTKMQPSGAPAQQQVPTTEDTPAVAPVTQAASQVHPSRDHALEDGFFARGEEEASSVPPASFDTDIESDEPLVRSRPEIVERRARFRRLVVGVVGAAAALTLVVTARALVAVSRPPPAVADTSFALAGHVVPSIAITAPETPQAEPVQAPPTEPSPAAQPADEPEAKVQPAAEPEAKVQPAPEPEAKVQPAPEPEAKVQPAPAAEPTAAPQAMVEPAPAVQPAAAPAAPAATPATKAEARRLIEHGKMRDGVTVARAAIASDPADAETYLLLGAALQELGQWKESMSVFATCSDRATKGPSQECRALRGRQ